ncbi:MAG: hypothetical protein R3E13_00390 [Alphaproteobacteria bacterium]
MAFLCVPVVGMHSAASAGPGVSAGCDPDFWNVLSARAEAEGQREMEAAQRLILKPDSTLQYSCFDGQLDALGSSDMFSARGPRTIAPDVFAALGLSTTPGSGLAGVPSSVVSQLQSQTCFDVTTLSLAELGAFLAGLDSSMLAGLLPSLPTSLKGVLGSVLGIDLNFTLPGIGDILGLFIPSLPSLASLPSISSLLPSIPTLPTLSDFLNISGLLSLPTLSSFIPSISISDLTALVPTLSLNQIGELLPYLSSSQLTSILPSLNLSAILPNISLDGLTALLPNLSLSDITSLLPSFSLDQIIAAFPSLSISDLTSLLPSLSLNQLAGLLPALDASQIAALLPSINLSSLVSLMSFSDIMELLPKLPDLDLQALIPSLPFDIQAELAALFGISITDLLNLSALDIKGLLCKADALGMLDPGGELDDALEVLVQSTNDDYISDNFGHSLGGGTFGGAAGPLCSNMGSVSKFMRCKNFDFDIFVTLSDMPSNDIRKFPAPCADAATRTAKWNAMLASAFPNPGQTGALDIIAPAKKVYNTLIKSHGDPSCATASPIPTGVRVIYGNSDYEDAICPIPGCFYDHTGSGSCKP